MDIGYEAVQHTCFFSPLDRKREECVRNLQEMCGLPVDDDFIRVLENNNIPNVDFSRQDVKIAKEIFGYSEHTAKGKLKYPQKGVQMKNNTDYYSLVPEKILEHYKNLHLDCDVMYVSSMLSL